MSDDGRCIGWDHGHECRNKVEEPYEFCLPCIARQIEDERADERLHKMKDEGWLDADFKRGYKL